MSRDQRQRDKIRNFAAAYGMGPAKVAAVLKKREPARVKTCAAHVVRGDLLVLRDGSKHLVQSNRRFQGATVVSFWDGGFVRMLFYWRDEVVTVERKR